MDDPQDLGLVFPIHHSEWHRKGVNIHTLLHGETTGKLGPMLAPVTSVNKRKGFVDASKLAAN
jgi:hypothetical protein